MGRSRKLSTLWGGHPYVAFVILIKTVIVSLESRLRGRSDHLFTTNRIDATIRRSNPNSIIAIEKQVITTRVEPFSAGETNGFH